MKAKLNTIFVSGIFLAFFCLGKSAQASDVSARSCSESDVQAAINECNNSAECRKVNVPAGTATWLDDVEIPVLNHDISIIGSGMSETILSLQSASGAFTLENNSRHYFIQISGFRFNFPNQSTTAITIKHTASRGFRVDNCYFYGKSSTGGMIGLKYVWCGLVDSCIFKDNNPGVNLPYGVSLGGPSINYPTCSDYNNQECLNTWDSRWWDNSEGHDGQVFNENYVPGTAEAIFVENNIFDDVRSSIMWNWGSKGAFVARYNRFSFTKATYGASAKPGSVWADIYNNEFICENETDCATVNVIRCSATIHNNSYKNINRPGNIEVYSGYHAPYLYTPQVEMDEVYIWNNDYDATTDYKGDCITTDDGNHRCGWFLNTFSYNTEGIDRTKGYVNRKPSKASGDRFDYAIYTCPHPLAGLGTCDASIAGNEGYHLRGMSAPKSLRLVQ